MKPWVLCVVVALGAACSELAAINPDVCGNGIVEAGEDCDSTNPRCVSCAIQCSETESCASYPGAGEGFVCGADAVCHAPAGTFQAPSELSSAVESFRVTDVNRDGIGDIMVQSQTALAVFYGNAEGAPVATTSTLTPIARGPASYAYLDGDSALDLLLPTADGIAAYTSTYGAPAPYPFPNFVGDVGTPLFGHQVAPGILAFIGTLRGETALKLIRIDVAAPHLPTGIEICGGATASELDPALVDVYTVEPNYQLVAMTLAPRTEKARICVMSIRETASGGVFAQVFASGPGQGTHGRVVLAPTRDRCPSLIFRTVTAGIVEVPGVTVGAGCALATPVASLLPEPGPGVFPVGWLPVGAASATKLALVFTDGIRVYAAGGLANVYVADRRIATTKFADLDGDGDNDVVATAHDALDTPVEDVDVLYQVQGAFLRYRLDTAGPVSGVELGDFDGNARPDVAVIQERARDGEASHEIAIAYGTADQLAPPVGLVSFSRVLSVVLTQLPDSTDPSEIVTDLAVLHHTGVVPQLTLLHGSPQRTLTGYFDPRPPTYASGTRRSQFRGVVGGHFEASMRPGLDLLAFDAVDEIGAASLADQHRTDLWISDGATGGVAETLASIDVPDLERCDEGGATSGVFCMENARYVSVPRPEGGADRVLGVSRTGEGILIERGSGSAVTTTRWDQVRTLAGVGLRELEMVELAEGARLVATFASKTGVVVCNVDAATALPTTCTNPSDLLEAEPGGPYTCTDVTVARVTAYDRLAATAPPAELVALCAAAGQGGAALFRLAPAGDAYAATRLLAIEDAQELRAGDINGDGVDDLVAVDRRGVIPTFRLYAQCTTRAAAGCRGAR